MDSIGDIGCLDVELACTGHDIPFNGDIATFRIDRTTNVGIEINAFLTFDPSAILDQQVVPDKEEHLATGRLDTHAGFDCEIIPVLKSAIASDIDDILDRLDIGIDRDRAGSSDTDLSTGTHAQATRGPEELLDREIPEVGQIGVPRGRLTLQKTNPSLDPVVDFTDVIGRKEIDPTTRHVERLCSPGYARIENRTGRGRQESALAGLMGRLGTCCDPTRRRIARCSNRKSNTTCPGGQTQHAVRVGNDLRGHVTGQQSNTVDQHLQLRNNIGPGCHSVRRNNIGGENRIACAVAFNAKRDNVTCGIGTGQGNP